MKTDTKCCLRWNWNMRPQHLKTSDIETAVDLSAFRLLTGELFFFFPKCRDRLWRPPSLLLSVRWGFFVGYLRLVNVRVHGTTASAPRYYYYYYYYFLTYALQPSRLIVWCGLDIPTFATRHFHVCHHARASSGGRWNCGREMSGNFATLQLGTVYML
jgi:hypothetical protein